MGSSMSTRKLTLVQDETSGIIKITDSLVQRLRGHVEGQAKAGGVTASASASDSVEGSPPESDSVSQAPKIPDFLTGADASLSPPPPYPEAPAAAPSAFPPPQAPPVSTPPPPPPPPPARDPYDFSKAKLPAGGDIPPWSQYAEEAHMMMRRLKEEKLQELDQLEADWRAKMKEREEEFEATSQLSKQNFEDSYKEVQDIFVKTMSGPVCEDMQGEVKKCYQENPKEALRCRREVDQFSQCVNLSRLQSVMKAKAG